MTSVTSVLSLTYHVLTFTYLLSLPHPVLMCSCINLSCSFLAINSDTRGSIRDDKWQTATTSSYCKLLHISQIRKPSKHLKNIKKGVMYSQAIKAFAWDTEVIWLKENYTTRLFSSLYLWMTSQRNIWKPSRLQAKHVTDSTPLEITFCHNPKKLLKKCYPYLAIHFQISLIAFQMAPPRAKCSAFRHLCWWSWTTTIHWGELKETSDKG